MSGNNNVNDNTNIVDGQSNDSEVVIMQPNNIDMNHHDELSNNNELENKIENNQKTRMVNSQPNLANRGLNAATGGAWNKARNAPIIGAAAKKAEDKLNDKIQNSKLGKKLNNHQRPNLGVEPKDNSKEEKPNIDKTNKNDSNDIGSRNLQKSLRDKTNKIWKNFNQKRKNKKEKESTDSNEENNDDTSTSQNVTNEIAGKVKRKIKIKIIIFASIALIVGLLVLSIIMAVFGVDISAAVPAINPKTYGTDEFQSTYEEGTKEYKDEIKYYEKLKKVAEDYEEKTGEELRTNYIHAILVYKYYLLDIEEEGSSENTYSIDYAKMENKVDELVKIMNPNYDNDDTYENTDGNTSQVESIDYEKNGKFYNDLKNSSFFKDYYRETLKEKKDIELLDEIFDLAGDVDSISFKDETVITPETKVTYNETNSNSSSNNKKISTKKTISITDYIAGVIYANTDSLSNSEKIKAYTVAYSTNIVAKNKSLTISSNNAEMSDVYCNVKEGCSYDNNGNLVDGPGERNSQNNLYYNGGYYYKKPLSTSEINSLNNNVGSVFGNVLTTTNGTYTTLDVSKLNGTGGDYQSMLNSAYNNRSIKNIGENSYVLDASYGSNKVLTDVIFYDQGDYSSHSFCGLKKETIKSSGCGVTSMAIVTSTYEKNKKYDPLYMNTEATKRKMCGSGSGTAQAFFCKEAKELGYKCLSSDKYDKSFLNLVLKHLSQGHLVVIRIGPGHFTGGGHYMVLGGIDPYTKKVYVYDPNNNSNSNYRKTGNGWYSFNDIIVKEAYNFYIIWKG